jgi:Tol biopolymer transport system component
MHALNATESWNTGAVQASFSSNGSLVYVPGGIYPEPEDSLVWVDRTGGSEPVVLEKRAWHCPRVSPDGLRIAYTLFGRTRELWLLDIHRGNSERLSHEGQAIKLNWTPDGSRITFSWRTVSSHNLYWQPWDGSGPKEELVSSEFLPQPGSWSADGKTLAFLQNHPDTARDIWVFHLEEKRAEPLVVTEFNEAHPEFSPDGRWLAYTSDESGGPEVYVRPYPGPGGRIPISTRGGTSPIWAPDGSEIYYRTEDAVISVRIETKPEFRAGIPRVLFRGQYNGRFWIRLYDISPDGQRFLMVEPGERETARVNQINLILNWFEELKRLVPTE